MRARDAPLLERTQRERLPTVAGAAVVGEVGTTVIGYVLTHAPPLYACQPVASSGQAAPALLVLFNVEESGNRSSLLIRQSPVRAE